MSLYTDVAFMLRRSSTASKLKVDRTLQHFEKQLKKSSEALVYQNLLPRVKFNLCCARILQGDYSQWDGWQFRDEWAAAMHYGIKDIPLWEGEFRKNLIVIGEQGIGDEVLWASAIPEAMIRCQSVTYACDGRLVEVFKRSFGIEAKERYVDARDDIWGFDAYIPAGDLFPMFRRRLADFPKRPYLKPDPGRVKEFEKYRGRTGISWKGRHGSIPVEEFPVDNPLSIQYDQTNEKVEIPDVDGMKILDLKNDIEGVIALISVLDRVVCVPTSVMHFAGALGVKCDVILPEQKTEFEETGVIDELDWHVPLGQSHHYASVKVFKDLKEYGRLCYAP